ncbi:Pentatricopeptide repeat-containing protein [Neolecta irregularis DAH-3]|uniref:Pentatricopeptide repeat-containing protein n=1 Tax=Neolecta irregularis (strain DAH-3) TaxID=1198029 RepID=A0A1U7LJ42_NEOID|nr:Pentatricopeptide repeat-containing protein [Neolecta irregularis DAH-3]|eukprot:OLL22572.1 Pentatricopeptide repeat-containing protein [Neolecta irregularis DAH-3]
MVVAAAAAAGSCKRCFVRPLSSTSAEHLSTPHPRDLKRRLWMAKHYMHPVHDPVHHPGAQHSPQPVIQPERPTHQMRPLNVICNSHYQMFEPRLESAVTKFLDAGQPLQAFNYWNTVDCSTDDNTHLERLILKLVEEGKVNEAESIWARLVKDHPYSTTYPEILLAVYNLRSPENPIISYWCHLNDLQKRNYVHFLWRAFLSAPDINGIKLLCTELKLLRHCDSETMFEKWVTAHDVLGSKVSLENWFKDSIFTFPMKKNSMRRYRQVICRLADLNDVDRIVKLHTLVSKKNCLTKLFHISTFKALIQAGGSQENVFTVYKSAIQHSMADYSSDRNWIYMYLCLQTFKQNNPKLLELLVGHLKSERITLPTRIIVAIIQFFVGKQKLRNAKRFAACKKGRLVPLHLSGYEYILKACVKDGDDTVSDNMFHKLLNMRSYSDTGIYNLILKLCTQGETIDFASQVFQMMQDKGIARNEETYEIMMRGYGNHSYFDGALQVFNLMRKDGIGSGNQAMILLNIGMQTKRYDMVLQHIFALFDTTPLQKLGITNPILSITPAKDRLALDEIVLSIFIDALCFSRNNEELIRLYNSLLCLKDEQPQWINKFICTRFVREFSRSRETLHHAIFIFQETVKRNADVWLYSALLNGFTKYNRMKDAELLVAQMNARGIQSNLTIYNQLMWGYIRQGNRETALRLYADMRATGINPDEKTLRILQENAEDTFEVD